MKVNFKMKSGVFWINLQNNSHAHSRKKIDGDGNIAIQSIVLQEILKKTPNGYRKNL
jgi:hypothetical protein